ncbi:MAG TPA: PEP/pyruvate-binding domain-containing protein [Planctomycetota bacterium]|jgi:membrane protein insertase Oxa1/YidC/SpoIIIJ/rhodanese-related sulfurtransferase/phosphohistidine swiveling domain-containing protein|nr:PEP/pyruvate-binding domain-containing protein [Planctomycetota bacterium]
MVPRSLRVTPVEVALAFVLLAGPAWAIPSPDVVVNVFSNLAHLLALGGAYLGGRALLQKKPDLGRRRAGNPRLLAILGLALAGSVVANFLQYRAQSDAKARRLTLNLFRTSKQAGRTIKDENLKTLDFSEQIVHPFGLDDRDVAAILGRPGCPPVVDVREDEEYAQAWLAGSSHARYPDMLAEPEKYLDPGVRTILFCWSGNRSAELVEALRPRGWDVVFVRGGYEKWRADGHPLEGWGATHGDPRDIPGYPNRTRLLDTDDVLAAMRRGKVVFVDNRYDTEFKAERLPDSIQICIRALPSAEIDRKIQELPKEPAYIGVVYDKRSGFFSTVVGSKLAKAGLRYLGRYTVPHELPPDAASVVKKEATLAAGSNFGFLAPLCEPLRSLLLWFGDRLGSIALGLIAAVVALRLFLLPLTAAAQRSAIRMNRVADEIRKLKARFAADPRGRRAALRTAYREAGVHPLLSILALVVQLFALMGLFRVVAGLEELQGLPLVPGWIDDLSVPDPWLVLPGAVGLATGALMMIGAERGRRGRWTVPCVTGLALAALVSPFRAAISLYLALSVGLAAVEKALVLASEKRRARGASAAAASRTSDGLFPLAEAARPEGIGGKARNLARLREAGFPVPDGFVAPAFFFDPLNGSPWKPTETQRSALVRAFRTLGAPRVAVRSSALREDGSTASYAGIFESVLDVDEERLPEAVGLVLDSFRSERAKAYGEASPPCVLVQRMVEPQWAGVAFTTHPLDAGALLIEAARGCAEDLVQGRLNPERVVLERETLAVESGRAEFPADQLARLALRIEAFFGRPQDVEWAFAEGRFFVLQSRDVTCRPAVAERAVLRERERRRLRARAAGMPPDRGLWKSTALTEDLPYPTELSLSLMRALWGNGGAVGAACRRLGLSYNARVRPEEVVETLFGRLYVNGEAEARLFPRRAWSLSAWRIERERRDYERRFRETVAPGIERAVYDEFLLDLSRMDDATLFETVRRRWRTYVEDHSPAVEVVNVLADWCHRVVEKDLAATDLRPADFLRGKAPGASARANALLLDVAQGREPLAAYLAAFGHRAEVDYELASPRFREVPERIERLLEALRSMNGNGSPGGYENGGGAGPVPGPAERAGTFAASLPRVRRRLFEENVAFLCAYETLKEDAKDLLVREVALLREAFLEVGRRRGLGDGVFDLTYEEALSLENPEVRLDALAAARRARREAFEGLELPPTVCPRHLEDFGLDVIGSPASEGCPNGRLAGLAVSRGRTARGRARVVRSLEDLGAFRPGEILVAPYTEPAWSVIFPRAGGVVTEVGGTLCHTAILAREYGLTAVVGVEGATRRIRTGDLLRIEADGGVLIESAGATPETFPSEASASSGGPA